MIVIVMGVSGAGKTTIGRLLAERLDCEFLDGDDFHPAQNVRKMAAGIPLEDADRLPWLERLNAELRRRKHAVLACSALKESYRKALTKKIERFVIVFLHGQIELIRSRLGERRHRYMPASLLESQFAALEPPAEAISIDVGEAPEQCVKRVLAALGSSRKI